MSKYLVFCLVMASLLVSCGKSDSTMVLPYDQKPFDSTDLFVKTFGSGEPIIVIHGGPLLDHSYFLPHFKEMEKDYQVILYDQRATGRNIANADSSQMNLKAFAEDVERIRRSYGLSKINILAHSWGALVALKYAENYPLAINKLILSNPVPASAYDNGELQLQLARQVTAYDSAKRKELMTGTLVREEPAKAIKELITLSLRRQLYDTASMDQIDFYIPEDYMTRSQLYSHMYPDLQDYSFYGKMTELKSPTLILHGEAELYSLPYSQKFANDFINAKVVSIEKTGHFPFAEKPDRFFEVLRSFLKTSN